MHSPVRVSAPTQPPVSLSDVKQHCRVDHNDDDTVLTSLLDAAVAHLDGWSGVLGRCLVTQTWRQDFEAFGILRLPLGPVASVTSVTYFDADNVQQTLPADVYTHLAGPLGDYVTLKPDQSWPSVYGRPDAVSVTYTAGSAVEDVPASVKAAIMLLVGHWYQNRETVITGTISTELPMSVDALLAPLRRVGL